MKPHPCDLALEHIDIESEWLGEHLRNSILTGKETIKYMTFYWPEFDSIKDYTYNVFRANMSSGRPSILFAVAQNHDPKVDPEDSEVFIVVGNCTKGSAVGIGPSGKPDFYDSEALMSPASREFLRLLRAGRR